MFLRMRVRQVLAGVVAAGVLGAPGAAHAEPIGFGPERTSPAGDAPGALVVADFDRDGLLDAATAGAGDDAIAVLRGKADGSYAAQPAVPVGDVPARAALEAGDVDRDGRIDLVTVSATGVRLLKGDGAGGFTASTLAPATLATRVTLADVDLDGLLDLVIGSGQTVVVRRGTGTGSFPVLASAVVGSTVLDLAVRDVDRDGRPDIAASLGAGEVRVLRLTGSVLEPAATVPLDAPRDVLTAADLDRDGDPDLIAAGGTRADAVVLRGGAGAAFTASRLALLAPARAVTVGDLDRDGRPDLVASVDIADGPDELEILRGTGTGGFEEQTGVPVAAAPYGLAVADQTRDGLPDLVAADPVLDVVAVRRGTTAQPVVGSFRSVDRASVGSKFDFPDTPVVADLDGDDVPDLAVTLYTPGTVGLLRGRGDGTFIPYGVVGLAARATGLSQGDVDRDGDVDLIAANGGDRVSLLRNDGTGRFVASTVATFPDNPVVDTVAVGDLDRDGALDVVVTVQQTAEVVVLRGDGTGAFTEVARGATGAGPTAPVLVDVDGDGLLDVATTNYQESNVSVLLGTGGGRLAPARTQTADDVNTGLAAGDFNRDGRPDLVSTSKRETSIRVLLNTGSGTFAARPQISVPGEPSSVAPGDFDRDGILDLAVATYRFGDRVEVLRGDGTGDFQPLSTAPSGPDPFRLTVADVDRDGRPDIVTGNYGDGTVSVLKDVLRGPDVELSPPAELALGAVRTGTTGAAATVTVTSAGGAPLDITSITVAGEDAGEVVRPTDGTGGTCDPAADVASGASCTVSVRLRPTSAGAKTARLVIASNAGGPPRTVQLTGAGTEPVIAVEPSVAFGSQRSGSSSAVRTVLVRNTGTAPLDLGAPGVGGEDAGQFALGSEGSCDPAVDVPAAGSCSIAVRFAPTSAGVKAARMLVPSDAAGSPSTVELSGTGLEPAIAVEPPAAMVEPPAATPAGPGAGPAAPPSAGPTPPAPAVPRDRSAVLARVPGRLRLDGRSIAVRVTCGSRPCSAVVTGRVRRGSAPLGTLGSGRARSLRPGASVRVRLSTSRALRRAVRRALARPAGSLTVTVRAVFTSPGARSYERTITIVVRRPRG